MVLRTLRHQVVMSPITMGVKDGMRRKYLDHNVARDGPQRRQSLQRLYEKKRNLVEII